MKLKEGMLMEEVDGEYVAVATGEAAKVFNGLIRNNKTADFLYRQLVIEKTEEELVEALLGKYDVTKEIATKDVHAFVAQLRKAGLLDE